RFQIPIPEESPDYHRKEEQLRSCVLKKIVQRCRSLVVHPICINEETYLSWVASVRLVTMPPTNTLTPMPTTPNTHPKDKSFSSPYQPGANRAYMTIHARWCMRAEKRLIWVEGRVIEDQEWLNERTSSIRTCKQNRWTYKLYVHLAY
ncbi:MAG TPA: hypothetical protein VK140_15095, partial [Ktedonobacteraceae bacterium]|nr:hypothetical protein [Ktedonobacteraceae bacterium]